MLVAHGAGQGAAIARAVVVAEAGDAARALTLLDELASDRLARHQPYHVARARVLELLGSRRAAIACLDAALSLTRDPHVAAYLAHRRGSLAAETADHDSGS